MRRETETTPGEELGVRPEAVVEVVREIAQELHPGFEAKLGLDSSLDKVAGIDSLGRIELLVRLERRFGVGLSEGLATAAETPRDLWRALSGAQAATAIGTESSPAAQEMESGEAAPEATRTLVDALLWHQRRHPDRLHISFEPSEGTHEDLTYGQLLSRSEAVARSLSSHGLVAGEAVGLMLPTCLGYFYAFFGVLMAGGVPVPLYPPIRPTQIEDHLNRQAAILRTALVKTLITFPQVRTLARLVKAQVPSLERVVTVEELSEDDLHISLPELQEMDTAFLQFTSGSTGDPKGVILTHANLLASLRAMGPPLAVGGQDRIVSWLPLYHDMGLIGAWMGALYFGVPLLLMSPMSFLTRPARWLWSISRHRGTVSAAPNFAYELCVQKIDDAQLEGLDLSSWRLALNGAEAVSAETVERFSERFAPYGFRPEAMTPVYGLAENSLGLTFSPLERRPRVDLVHRDAFQRAGRASPASAAEERPLRFVSCGFPIAGHEVRVVDPAGHEVGDREEGRVEFRGPAATTGYFRNPDATAKLFRGGWLSSGDLGYLADGELFVTGRIKDVIIRAGRNIYPEEIESAVGELEGVRRGCVAVFGTSDPESGTERLIVMAEIREDDPDTRRRLEAEIREVAFDLIGTPPDEVVLAPPHTVPKTSSGKIRRAACREIHEGGGALRRQKGVRWQIVRLAWSGARPQLRRWIQTIGDYLWAAYVWTVAILVVLPLWLALAILPGLGMRRRLTRWAARALVVLSRTPLRVEGREYLDEERPRVIASNHSSYLDSFILCAILPADVAFVVKKELDSNLFTRVLLRRIGAVFVERFDAEQGVADTRRALEALKSGETLVIFPEGTFARAGGLLPFRMGAFVTAAQAGVPVLPVGVKGTRSLMRGDELFPRRAAVSVKICPPLAPQGEEWADALRVRDRVREAIQRATGERALA